MPQLHGAIFAAVRGYDAAVATALHSVTRKPFTLTLLQPNGQGSYITTLGLLDDALATCFEESLGAALHRSFDLRSQPFTLANLEVTTRPYQDMLDSSDTLLKEEQFILEFLTPTAFRHRTENYLFPEPQMVFRSLLERWNCYAPQQIGDDLLTMVYNHIWPARYGLSTACVSWSKGYQIGFKGEVQYALRRAENIARQDLQSLSTLISLAYYAGIGIKTTMGMGEVAVR